MTDGRQERLGRGPVSRVAFCETEARCAGGVAKPALNSDSLVDPRTIYVAIDHTGYMRVLLETYRERPDGTSHRVEVRRRSDDPRGSGRRQRSGSQLAPEIFGTPFGNILWPCLDPRRRPTSQELSPGSDSSVLGPSSARATR